MFFICETSTATKGDAGKMGKRKIKLDGMTELSQVVVYLESIVNGLKEGTLHVQLGGDNLVMQPPAILDFELEVSQKKDKEALSIELSWKNDPATAAKRDIHIGTDGPSLDIS